MASGRRYAAAIAGRPETRVSTCQPPSPDSAGVASGRTGSGRAGPATAAGGPAEEAVRWPPSGDVAGGVPPTLGGRYVCRSSQVTAPPRRWSRAHSDSRAETLSVPGALNTRPIDTAGNSSRTTATPAATVRTRRAPRLLRTAGAGGTSRRPGSVCVNAPPSLAPASQWLAKSHGRRTQGGGKAGLPHGLGSARGGDNFTPHWAQITTPAEYQLRAR